MYKVELPKKYRKDKMYVKASKTRVQLETCKSGVYSYYEKASRKMNNRLDKYLKAKDYARISYEY